MSEPGKDPTGDVKAKGQAFIEGAKTGTLTEGQLKWGLSAAAIVSGVSLFLDYWPCPPEAKQFAQAWGHRVAVTGLDQLSSGSIEAFAIPISAIFALYLHFGEPSLKLFKMETPGRSKLIYLIGMIVAALGLLGCLRFVFNKLLIGNVLGLLGIGLLAFVYFKLWQLSPTAEAAGTPPSAPPPPSVPPPAPPGA